MTDDRFPAGDTPRGRRSSQRLVGETRDAAKGQEIEVEVGEDPIAATERKVCEECGGLGEVSARPCAACGGSGRAEA